MALIELDNICRTYTLGEIKVPVLRGITLRVQKGELVALMGASGSGKSTLMNILGCLDRPTSGSYRLEGEDVSQLSRDALAAIRNRTIGFVFQNFNLLPRSTALEQVMMPLDYAERPPAQREAASRAREMLEKLGLAERMHHHPSQLSGGQQQRVAIARALINRPPLLFADEPTGNLDSKTSAEILAMLQELNQRDGITLVLVTHDLEVAKHAKRIIHIKDGLIEDGHFGADEAHPAVTGSNGTAR